MGYEAVRQSRFKTLIGDWTIAIREAKGGHGY